VTALERAWRGGRSDWKLHLLSVFSVAVAFVCLTAALLVVVNVAELRDRWARAGRASIYLQQNASEGAIQDLERALRDSAGVSAVRFVSTDDARRDVLANASDPVLAALPPEAFPASLEVELSSEADPHRMEALVQQLSLMPAVETVETYQNWTERLESLLSGGVSASLLLAAVVLAAVISVVGSTIRLSLQRRRTEVEVLKVIGATDRYVESPFLVEGAVQGAAGALVALLLLGVLFVIVRSSVHSELALLVGTAPRFLPWHWGLGLVALGGTMGALAAHLSLRKLLVV
jgi:cell division transport system permease protein